MIYAAEVPSDSGSELKREKKIATAQVLSYFASSKLLVPLIFVNINLLSATMQPHLFAVLFSNPIHETLSVCRDTFIQSLEFCTCSAG